MVRESITTSEIDPAAASFSILSMRSDCSSKLWTWKIRRFLMPSSWPANTWESLSADSPSVSM